MWATDYFSEHCYPKVRLQKQNLKEPTSSLFQQMQRFQWQSLIWQTLGIIKKKKNKAELKKSLKTAHMDPTMSSHVAK